MSSPRNPYAAPAGSQNDLEVSQPNGVVPAGQGSRFLNLLIDYVALMALSFLSGMLAFLIGGEDGIELMESTPGALIGIPLLVGYYFICEATTSRTLGKLITGTKVVDANGEKPSLGKIAGRTFARMIPFEAFTFLGTPTRGWHDSLPSTYVIKSR